MLELLDLSGNCLTFVPPLRGSKRLTYLDLSYNNITSLPILTFKNLPVLKEIRVSHNRILTVTPMTFMDVPRLEELYLRNNSIGILEANSFHAFELLQILDLSVNQIPAVRFLYCT